MSKPQLSVTEAELERFFGGEATRSDTDIPWPYNGLLFTATRHEFRLVLDLKPSYKHVELTVHAGGQLLYQLSSPALEDIRIHPDPTHDTLELVVSQRDSIFVRLSPSVLITQQTWDGT